MEVFAGVVYARVTRAYPTMALASRIAATDVVPQPHRQPVLRFFQNNTDLDLLRQNLSVYLANRGAAAFEGISEDQRPAVVASARTFQRVLRIAPGVDAAQNLLTTGISRPPKSPTLAASSFSRRPPRPA